MAEFSDYLENALLDHAFGEGVRDMTSPLTLYVALCTVTPTDTMTGSTITEPAVGGYARQAVTFNAASAGSVVNSADVVFSAVGAAFPSAVGLAICDAATLGNLLAFDGNMTAVTVGDGETLTFTGGSGITVSLD